MITGRVIGGIIALVGGALVVVACLLNTAAMVPKSNLLVAWIMNLIIGLWAISGGLLGIYKQRTGSFFPLVAGVAAIVCEALYWVRLGKADYLFQYVPLETWILGFAIPFVTIEGILMAVGGFVILAYKK